MKNYRKATIEDLGKLQKLGILAYSQHKLSMTAENWDKFSANLYGPELYTELIESATCFICELEDEVIGMAFLVSKGHPTELFDETWSYIRMVGVHPNFSGNGIAKKLTEMCIEFAQEDGENFVALHTSEFMEAARHIYQGFGFIVVREFSRYDKKYWIYLLELYSDDID
ncbi:MAG: GNAT family N-acetyltransferase [Flavobacteriales bacterium]